MVSEDLRRIVHPKMEYYRYVFRHSKRWNREENKRVIVYCEQGYGDIIQFSRYIPYLKDRCSEVILYCPKALHRLFEQFDCQLTDKKVEDLPPHDFHVLSLSLPFVLDKWDITAPYIQVAETEETPICFKNLVKIGVAWEGNQNNEMSPLRDCPYSYFKSLISDNSALFMLQRGSDSLTDDLLNEIPINGIQINDFYDTARLINAMDIVVSVDTAVLHLAGAMGKPTFGLLSHQPDYRWSISNWYDSVTLIKQKKTDDWDKVFTSLIGLFKMRGNMIGENHV